MSFKIIDGGSRLDGAAAGAVLDAEERTEQGAISGRLYFDEMVARAFEQRGIKAGEPVGDPCSWCMRPKCFPGKFWGTHLQVENVVPAPELPPLADGSVDMKRGRLDMPFGWRFCSPECQRAFALARKPHHQWMPPVETPSMARWFACHVCIPGVAQHHVLVGQEERLLFEHKPGDGFLSITDARVQQKLQNARIMLEAMRDFAATQGPEGVTRIESFLSDLAEASVRRIPVVGLEHVTGPCDHCGGQRVVSPAQGFVHDVEGSATWRPEWAARRFDENLVVLWLEHGPGETLVNETVWEQEGRREWIPERVKEARAFAGPREFRAWWELSRTEEQLEADRASWETEHAADVAEQVARMNAQRRMA